MTNREFLTAVSTNTTIDTEVSAFATAALAKLDEANEKRRNTPSKTAIENAPIIENILANVLTVEPMTASDVAAAAGISTQKASSLLRQLGVAGKINVGEAKMPKKGVVKVYSLMA